MPLSRNCSNPSLLKCFPHTMVLTFFLMIFYLTRESFAYHAFSVFRTALLDVHIITYFHSGEQPSTTTVFYCQLLSSFTGAIQGSVSFSSTKVQQSCLLRESFTELLSPLLSFWFMTPWRIILYKSFMVFIQHYMGSKSFIIVRM